jgi:hypothetical protein
VGRLCLSKLSDRSTSDPLRDYKRVMLLVLIGWLYVAVLMAAAEATSPQGTLLGAFFTLMFYGIGPIGIVMYLMGTPLRLRARKEAEAEPPSAAPAEPGIDPDAGGHAAAGAALPGVATKREEP